ncbi:sensor histidine kinase [Anaeromicropila populeti]|uniref:histidine kinase n=1 Tax=Anaeromicropila populeti TaxID=37658 RepID=A0A1I6IWK2_9FIRM|nr:histidine kinase N-terminal 7TM domain-containing protein [Anaeromicropila populeti]SFR71061.1 Histidine kinase [Anaeromicropila populeti]
MESILLGVINVFSIIMLLYSVGWLLIRGNKNRITYSFVLCQLLIVVWCMAQLLKIAALSRLQMLVAYDISYVGMCFIGPTWLLFCLYYSNKKPAIPLYIGLYGIAIFHYLVVLTNELHHLFYTYFEMDGTQAEGLLFKTHIFYTYGCIIAGIILIYGSFINRLQKIAVLSSAIIPFLLNVCYLSHLFQWEGDITPAAFSVSSILIMLAAYRYHFLNVNALAFDKAFRMVSEGIVIYNKSGKITYVNYAVTNFFPITINDSIDQFFQLAVSYDKTLVDNREISESEHMLCVENNRTFQVKKYNHFDKKKHYVATTMIFTDMTRHYELLARTKELAVSNQCLAIEKERNRIAQEVHDTTGHTLTMIQSLMNLSQLELDNQDINNLKEYLSQAKQLANHGIKELRCSINNLRQQSSYELVTQGILQLTRQVKELEIEVCIQGEDHPRYSHLSVVLYESMREVITNCLRYAKATHMDVILKFRETSVELYVFDNGIGCEKIIEGNGLTGIRTRIEGAGGTVKVISNSMEGFQTIIKLPLNDGGNI